MVQTKRIGSTDSGDCHDGISSEIILTIQQEKMKDTAKVWHVIIAGIGLLIALGGVVANQSTTDATQDANQKWLKEQQDRDREESRKNFDKVDIKLDKILEIIRTENKQHE